ncbi:MAG: hypothetical protein JXQ84_04680 [Rhodospirillaceae bacterium]|nr:hypothetical protein [Rhodospirillaceae bacterium]
MAELSISLPVGLKSHRTSAAGEEEVIHRDAVLRELETADIINAGAEAEKVVLGEDGDYHLVQSPTLAGLHMLRRQIVRIGDIDGPFEVADLLRLNRADFNALQDAADQLDAASLSQMQGTTQRGRGDAAS